jgi:glyoxylase-like metal-dependent hydrolase (beta-lactamase superfamily II)
MLEKIHVVSMEYDDDMVNSVFFFEKGTLAVIDTGVRQQRERLLNEIAKFDFQRLFVIITHPHYDHIGNNYAIFEKFHPIFITHLKSKRKIEDYSYQIQSLQRSVKGCYQFPDTYKHSFLKLLDQEISVNISFNNSMNLHLGNARTLKLIHLPGHTAGDIALIDKKTKTIMLSELIFEHSRNILVFIDNFKDYIRSLRRLKKIIISENIHHLITSHNKNILMGGENICNVIDINLDYACRLKTIAADCYKTGLSLEKCTQTICKKYSKIYSPGAIITVKALLNAD